MSEEVICPYNTNHSIEVKKDMMRTAITCPTCKKEVGVVIGRLIGVDESYEYTQTRTIIRLDVGEDKDAVLDILSEGGLALGTWADGDIVSLTYRKGRTFPRTVFNHSANSWYKLRESSKSNPFCFIATAAYGTPLAPEINILREFRDEKLETGYIGPLLVNAYYKISPPIADFIKRRELLRTITRFFLNPIIFVIKLLMRGDRHV